MKHVATLCLEFDGIQMPKALQVLFDKDGNPKVGVTLEGMPDMYILGISNNMAAVVNSFPSDTIEVEGEELESHPMGVVRMCLIKEDAQIPPDHKTFIRGIMENPNDELKILVSEGAPEGYDYEYFLKVSDEVQDQIRRVVLSGEIPGTMQ